MFHTKDSVEDLRKSRKRSHSSSSTVASSTPLEELRQLVKRRYYYKTTNHTQTTLPQRSSTVRFALDKNTERLRSYDNRDLQSAWMSRAEATIVKLRARATVKAFQQGTLDNTDCIRGLEVHADPVRTERKISRCHNYTRRILEQQHLLCSIMGKANDQILARLSCTLSAEDVRDASEVGKRDATEALYINICDEALRRQALLPSGDKLAQDDSLSGLLIQPDDLLHLWQPHALSIAHQR